MGRAAFRHSPSSSVNSKPIRCLGIHGSNQDRPANESWSIIARGDQFLPSVTGLRLLACRYHERRVQPPPIPPFLADTAPSPKERLVTNSSCGVAQRKGIHRWLGNHLAGFVLLTPTTFEHATEYHRPVCLPRCRANKGERGT